MGLGNCKRRITIVRHIMALTVLLLLSACSGAATPETTFHPEVTKALPQAKEVLRSFVERHGIDLADFGWKPSALKISLRIAEDSGNESAIDEAVGIGYQGAVKVWDQTPELEAPWVYLYIYCRGELLWCHASKADRDLMARWTRGEITWQEFSDGLHYISPEP